MVILIYGIKLQNQIELDLKNEKSIAPISSENVVKTDGNNPFDRIEEEIETNFSYIKFITLLTKLKWLLVFVQINK